MPDAPRWFDALLRPGLASLRAYAPSRPPLGAARLDANECPWALDADARRELDEALSRVELHRYPDPRASRLRERLAERTGAHPDDLVIGCGSDEVIALLLGALARPREGRASVSVSFPDPTFVMYRATAISSGHDPVAVPLDAGWDLDVDPWREALSAHAPHAVFLATPNNPTGNDLSRGAVEAIVDAARDALVVIDEAYGAFSTRDHRDLRASRPNVATLGTLSKVGLAAARVGWAALPRGLAAEVDKARQPYNLNSLSQAVGELALGPLAPAIDAACARVIEARGALREALSRVDGVAVSPSSANFLWIELPRDAGEVHAELAARGVLVRSFHASGGRLARRIRVTVGTPDENARFVEALRASL